MARPPLFSALSFDEALARTKAEGKLLLVDATAAWCGPCQVMDRTTWSDAKLVEALAPRALALQIDVDAEKELAQQLAIRAMPTVIAFRDGAELDRVVGLQSTRTLLQWLDGLARGETSLQRLEQEARAHAADMHLRMQWARKLVDAGRLDQATDEYEWLWLHMLEHQPAMVGVKHSFFLGDIGQLIARHEPARVRFEALRAQTAPPSQRPFHADKLADWISLNAVLKHSHATLDWFDQATARRVQFDVYGSDEPGRRRPGRSFRQLRD